MNRLYYIDSILLIIFFKHTYKITEVPVYYLLLDKTNTRKQIGGLFPI